jgi:hypothetical protein
MSFSAEWLALREPHDRAARNPDVLAAVRGHFAGRTGINVVDLACGAGSTLRAVAPHLPMPQRWSLVDNDLGLLLRAGAQALPDGVTIRTQPIDLVRDLEAALDGPVDLVTASALIDLVSAEWLERFATEVAARRLPAYVALSYDGDMHFVPPDSLDAKVRDAFNAHQRRDKGFGAALGPHAATRAAAMFERCDYAVTRGPSPWVLDEHARTMQSDLVTGFAAAAQEQATLSIAELTGWIARRRTFIAAGRSQMTVGHVDLFATPIGTR